MKTILKTLLLWPILVVLFILIYGLIILIMTIGLFVSLLMSPTRLYTYNKQVEWFKSIGK